MGFAKLYETEEYGQILVKLDTNDEMNPEVRYFFEPKNLGVCSIATIYQDDSEKSWDSAELIFNDVCIDSAIEMVKTTMKSLKI